MTPRTPGQDLYGLLRKPLEYAAALDPSRLHILANLEHDLQKILDDNPRLRDLAPGFEDALEGLSKLPPEKRAAQIVALVRLLDQAEKNDKTYSRPSPSPPLPDLEHSFKSLATEVQWVKGVGPRVAEMLKRLNILTVEDLLFHVPSRYDDRRNVTAIRDLKPGMRATVIAKIMASVPVNIGRYRRGFEMALGDGTGLLAAKWFQYHEYLEKRYRPGMRVAATSTVRSYNSGLEMHHPELDVIEEDEDEPAAGIVPVYPSTEGLFQRSFRRIAENAMENYLDRVPEILPREILARRALPSLPEALALVHSPPEDADLAAYNAFRSPAHRRLVYDEFFFLELGLALRRRGVIEEPAVAVPEGGALMARFRELLPFKLTGDQEKVIADIGRDMSRGHPMHRLLQGDVGSGKTVVAVMCALGVIEAGHQAAIMAPTEVLAEQHHQTIRALLEDIGIEPVLLTGNVKGMERSAVYRGIATGKVQLIVGTHAVIQEKVEFKSLALGIIDEQHRFGVMQRAKLKAKGPEGTTPHLLVMTATPIPRTLAMTVYGDLAVSVIREMPPGRKPIKTKVVREKDVMDAWQLVREEAKKGRQAYIVYPLVEESEQLELRDATSMSEYFRGRVFPDLKVGLVHGRMKSEEKDAVMRAFGAGEIQVLVATTVIEVGIDVRNATVMAIEHADRFGLSQLHQLRGRVGRGEHASHCLLITGFTRSEDAWKRLMVMTKTSDGFKIAEEDLALRGPGEFFGTRQSGLPDFRVANIIRDSEVLSEAREDAFAIVKNDPHLTRPEHQVLMRALKRRWGRRLRLGQVG